MAPPTSGATWSRRSWLVDCSDPIVGARMGLRGLTSSGLSALLKVRRGDGRLYSALLTDDGAHRIPVMPSVGAIFGRYVASGVGHLLGGFDHLLFFDQPLSLGSPLRDVFDYSLIFHGQTLL